MKILSICLVLLLSTHVVADHVIDTPLRIFTTTFPPYSYVEDQQVKGLSVQVVKRVLADAGIKHKPMEIYPWARSYTMVQDVEHSMIFSIAFSQERENLFLWGGAIAPYHINLYRLKSRSDIQLENLEQAKNYVIAGELQDIKQRYLISQGFVENENLVIVPNSATGLRMLTNARIDLLPFSSLALPEAVNELNIDIEELEVALALPDISYDLRVAFNPKTPQATVDKFNQALQALHDSGWIAEQWLAYQH